PFDFETSDFGDPSVTTQILQNTGTKLILRQPNPQSAQLCAELGATQLTHERTVQMVDRGLLMGIGSSGVMSDKIVHEFIVHPTTLKQLPTGKAFLIQDTGPRVLIELPYAGLKPEGDFAHRPGPSLQGEEPLDLPKLLERAREEEKG